MWVGSNHERTLRVMEIVFLAIIPLISANVSVDNGTEA